MNNLDYCEMWYRLKEKLDARERKHEATLEYYDVTSLDSVLTKTRICEINYIKVEMQRLKQQIETEAQRNG